MEYMKCEIVDKMCISQLNVSKILLKKKVFPHFYFSCKNSWFITCYTCKSKYELRSILPQNFCDFSIDFPRLSFFVYFCAIGKNLNDRKWTLQRALFETAFNHILNVNVIVHSDVIASKLTQQLTQQLSQQCPFNICAITISSHAPL